MRFFISFILLFILGCGKPIGPTPPTFNPAPHKHTWADQPRDEKGRWISELTAYAKKHEITHEIAEQAGAPFEQYVYDYSESRGPKLNAEELHDYEAWKAFTAKK